MKCLKVVRDGGSSSTAILQKRYGAVYGKARNNKAFLCYRMTMHGPFASYSEKLYGKAFLLARIRQDTDVERSRSAASILIFSQDNEGRKAVLRNKQVRKTNAG